jgi:hypothetical protein
VLFQSRHSAGLQKADFAVMPDQSHNDPKHWRNRAAEMRMLAEEMDDADTKSAMLKLAGEYDKLAARAEMRANGKPIE